MKTQKFWRNPKNDKIFIKNKLKTKNFGKIREIQNKKIQKKITKKIWKNSKNAKQKTENKIILKKWKQTFWNFQKIKKMLTKSKKWQNFCDKQ